MRRTTPAGLATALTNASVAAMYGFFAAAHLVSFASRPRVSTLLVTVMEVLFGFFFFFRHDADRASRSAWDWFTTVVGTFAPLLFRPTEAPLDLLAGQLLQLLGAALAIAGVLSLNRSIGLVPAHRGVKVHGPYGWVRHPLYSAYSAMNAGYLVSNYTHWNLLLVLVTFAFAVLRLRNEERFLSQYPDYAAYMRRTRWRLLPYVY